MCMIQRLQILATSAPADSPQASKAFLCADCSCSKVDQMGLTLRMPGGA